MRIKVLLFFYFFFFAPSLFANVYPIQLSERIDGSQQVVVAKAIREESYWEADSSGIYTSYTMEVLYYTKNANGVYYFDLLLPGGTVDDEVQINYPHIQLEVGQEYLITTENVTFYQLNRKHRARSANPKYQPYSYVQGVLPMYNGVFHDYFEPVPFTEDSMLTIVKEQTLQLPLMPDGTIFEARAVSDFAFGNGDFDLDGVLNTYDSEPHNPYSDSDGDGVTDLDEAIGVFDIDKGIMITSNPLNVCDPNPLFGGCIGIDLDGDGSYLNYSVHHPYYDPDDNEFCVPYASGDCELIDFDQDGFYGNLPPTDSLRDPNDNNPCVPTKALELGVIQDSWINAGMPSTNYGDSTWLRLSEEKDQYKRAVVQFDFLPANIPISSIAGAELQIYVGRSDTSSFYQLEIHNLLRGWTEGSSPRGPVNWEMAEPNVPWDPTHFSFSTFGLASYVNTDGWITIPINLLLLQSWINNENKEINLLLKLQFGANQTLSIASSESANPPRLSVFLNPLYCELPKTGTALDETATPSSQSRVAISITDGEGTPTTTFVGGTIESANDIIITGADFGTEVGTISFPNSDNGGNNSILVTSPDLVYWREDGIRVKIPKNAGSGTMTIQTESGTTIASTELTINWSLNPLYHDQKAFASKTRQRVKFVDANGSGGYSLQINTTSGFADDTEAVAALERALTTWQCATDVNWTLDKTGTTTTAGKDDYCVIEYSTTLPAGVLALTTSSYKGSSSGGCDQHNTLWRLRSFDIKFAAPSSLPAQTTWNLSTDDPAYNEFDFETIALHEFGHAHGLAHVIDEESVMHFSIANGTKKRSLHEHEMGAGFHKMSYSLTDNCISSYHPMTTYTGKPCRQAAPSNFAKIKVFLEGAYKEETGTMTTQLSTDAILPLTQPFNQAPYNYAGKETVTSVPALVVDWLLLELRASTDMNQVLHQQAVFLRNDGSLIALDGTENIAFPDLGTDSCYIAVHHQSHLPIISNTPHPIQTTAALYDFTSAVTMAMGEGQLKEKNGDFVMNCGDFDSNGLINNEDYNLWKVNSSSIDVYSPADADGNGVINNLDYNLWKVNLSKIGTLRN